METFCTAPRHSKYRPAINSNSFHHPSSCSRTYRQNEYGFINSTRSPAPGWHERPYTPANKSRGKFCSIALGASIVLVLVAVISIVGLAFHMGALRSDPTPLATYSCSIRLLKGDRFLSNLSVKARRYRVQFESLFQRSILGPSLVSCAVDKFGNDTLTIHLKLSLNRRKIPRHIHTVEKAIKDIILGDAHLRRPIFQNIKFDPNNLIVKQTNDGDSYQKSVTTFKERPKSNLGGQLKQPNKNNFTLTTVMPIKKPSIEEVVTKEEDLPVIQGSFKISKTEADITQKKEIETETQKAKTPSVTHHPLQGSTLKETYITSALFKLASGEKSNKTTSTITSTTKQPTVTTHSPITTTYTIESSMVPNVNLPTTNTEPPSSILFSVSPSVFDQEPWVPIYSLPQDSDSPLKPIMVNHKPTYYSNQPPQEPVYTSFTNPGLSLHSFDTEKLGKNKLQGHPIPVNKISETTETPIWNNANVDFETTSKGEEDNAANHETKDSLTEVAIIQHVSASQENKSHNETILGTDRNNVKLTKSEVLKNISSIFYSLASSLGLPSVYLDTFKQNATEQPVDVQEIKESTTGQGQVEVIDVDEASLIMETTTAPLVTLLPAKSNSGVGRPIRPRPQTNNKTYSANRSFPNEATKVPTNLQASIKPPKEENMQIFGFLNFQTDLPSSPPTPAALIDNSDVLSNESFNFDNTHSSNPAGFKILSPEKIKQLSQISNLTTNRTRNESIFSTKALSSGYNSNEDEFKILTKTFNKAPNFSKAIDTKSSSKYNSFQIDVSNKTDCSNFTVKCGDGQCLPDTTRCNQLMDCNDGSDEKGCNCADYLRSQFLLRKICDGIVDCWDYSDENHCDWCSPGQYVCGNSKICINRTSICDGIRDCPLGDDERQCVTVAPNINAADEFPYYSEGYLMIRKRGTWGKLCVDNFKEVVAKSHTSWAISDLGQAVCKAMTYKSLDKVKIHTESKQKPIHKKTQYYELSYSIKPDNKSSLTFENSSCPSGDVIRVKCETLECGTRPQASKQLARIVGGGNAGLGAWPWQAALYKEGEFQCGATLISEKWLLSAGHCFYHSQQDHWVVRLGALRRGTTFPSPYEQLRPIVQIILHPDYVDSGFLNDISLLRMETAVIFSDYVRPVCLPPPGVAPQHGRTCTVIGWGQLFEIGRIFPDTLQEVQVPVISTVECRKRTLFLPLYRVTDDMFCAGYDRGGRDACLGDSGGPLMCPESDGRWTLHGITSNGYGCARAYRPGVYTKVSNYIPWINSHIYGRDNLTTITKNSCAGHRCPLGECLPKSNLCNGFIECSDGSDEVGCLNTST